jgi:hypothetical protein
MMKKQIATSLGVILLAAFAAQGQNGFWSGRFGYDQVGGNAYNAQEFSLDLMGMYATRDKSGQDVDAWGLGVGLNYFFTRNMGVGADTYADAFEVPYLLNASFIYRYPVSDTGFAPYGFAGFGRQWEHAPQWMGHIGLGIEYRINVRTGVFVDARRVFPVETGDYAVWRAGMRFGF